MIAKEEEELLIKTSLVIPVFLTGMDMVIDMDMVTDMNMKLKEDTIISMKVLNLLIIITTTSMMRNVNLMKIKITVLTSEMVTI